MFDYLLRGGRIVDGTGLPWFRADLAIKGDRIAAIGHFPDAAALTVLDVTGLVVAPGFVDTHVHGDLALLVDPDHEPAIRQGVTTYVLGQDGVAFAPASEATLQYMRRYTAGFNGNFPTPDHQWHSVAEFLEQFHRRCALNVCTLVPNGNLRMEVLGLDPRPATPAELEQMRSHLRMALEQGAVGLSSGLDYVPSLYADVDELSALCEVLTAYGGVYVTHMRGYTPEKAPRALEEVFTIARRTGCPVHVSHFNCLARQTLPLLETARQHQIDITFDLYCYLYGSTIVAMLTLPPEVLAGGIDATCERLRQPETRRQLEIAFAHPRFPIETIRLSSVPHPDWQHYEGYLLVDACCEAYRLTAPPTLRQLVDFTCDLLIATDLAAGCVIRHFAQRQEQDILELMRSPWMMAGSDGIFVGSRPHPRGFGCFARYLGHHVRRQDWTLEEAVSKCAWHGARRFGLAYRGQIREGWFADLAVFDPQALTDHATYDHGTALATGMQHVFVNGEPVLLHGQRTSARPGRALRRGQA
ncbi:MAG: D-aminoacylase [Thermogemmata sp.]|uniref:D-aminoacylase n=1 Tax=Thermogemmata fonticola TaxID=2755323 RepID=A0A7V9AAN9_9BACT|nr:D-aminoacylase [Thermogemmata fonticola]MBA2225336.1 D-aminoacylase [Thermogemmata fonticola]GIW84811.1 MAG: N-acyl-D-amino-acid deacylase [Gemmataceae bacterium]